MLVAITYIHIFSAVISSLYQKIGEWLTSVNRRFWMKVKLFGAAAAVIPAFIA